MPSGQLAQVVVLWASEESCHMFLMSCLFIDTKMALLSSSSSNLETNSDFSKYQFEVLVAHNLLRINGLHESLNNNISCLPSPVPDLGAKVFVCYHLNIKSNGRNSSNDFSSL